MVQCVQPMQIMQPIEDVISLIASRRRIAINDVEEIFNLPNNSTRSIIDFLLKFEFIKMVDGRYLVLSETCSPFFDEIMP
jgi:predicted transcriptional regulator of viral defense system